jgi:hypothetical protein
MMSKISRKIEDLRREELIGPQRYAALYEQLERDVAWRKEQDRVWTEFLDALTGGRLEVPDEMLDEEDELAEDELAEDELAEDELAEDEDIDNEWGTMRDGMRRFKRNRP